MIAPAFFPSFGGALLGAGGGMLARAIMDAIHPERRARQTDERSRLRDGQSAVIAAVGGIALLYAAACWMCWTQTALSLKALCGVGLFWVIVFLAIDFYQGAA